MAADLADYGYGLGFAGGAEATRQAIVSGGPLPFQLFLALGVVAGSAAAIRRPLRLPGIPRAGGAFAGGMLMGVGATTAKACNIGHGVTGLGLLSLTRGRGRHGRGGYRHLGGAASRREVGSVTSHFALLACQPPSRQQEGERPHGNDRPGPEARLRDQAQALHLH